MKQITWKYWKMIGSVIEFEDNFVTGKKKTRQMKNKQKWQLFNSGETKVVQERKRNTYPTWLICEL